MELNTDRPGFNYRNFDLTAADANPCRAQCEAETQCLSWTYVAPGVQGVNARCWLKKAVPQQMAEVPSRVVDLAKLSALIFRRGLVSNHDTVNQFAQ